MTIPSLKPTLSTGPKEPMFTSTGCAKCHVVPFAGARIVKLGRVWWHQECAEEFMRTLPDDVKWVALGEALANRPRDFSVTETRAIVANMVRISSLDLYTTFEEPEVTA